MLRNVVLLLSLFAPPHVDACGLDLFGVCKDIDKITKSIDALPKKLQDAAEDVLDQLFNHDLPPAIDKLTAAAKSLEDRAEKDYEAAINATRIQLDALATKVISLVEGLAKDVTKDVEQIVQLVSKDVLGDATKIIADVDTRVNALLSRLENDGKELFCAATGYIDTFEEQFANFFAKQDCDCVQRMLQDNPGLAQDCQCTSCFHVGGVYPRCPCKPWGMKFAPGWYNRGKYQFLKCHLEKPIDWGSWTVDQIVNQLSIIQGAALSFRCLEDMQPASTRNRQYFSDEYTNLTHSIIVWTNDAINQRLKVQGARGAIAQDGPCVGKTIEQCVEQAMEQLSQAQKQLADTKADLLEAESTFATKKSVTAVSTALHGNVTELASTIHTDKTNIEADIQTAVANAKGELQQSINAVSTSSVKYTDQIQWCDCYDATLVVQSTHTGHQIVSCGSAHDSKYYDYQCNSGFVMTRFQGMIGGGNALDTCYEHGDKGIAVTCCRPCVNKPSIPVKVVEA